MKKWVRFLCAVIVLCIVYTVFLFFSDRRGNIGGMPIIDVPNDILEVSVNDDESKLLTGLKAYDKEDGDLSTHIFVESMSGFDSNQCRQVTLGVFDNDDNLTRVTRTIKYVDYQKPEIDLKKALCYYYVSSKDEYKDFVSASSLVDGDLSSKITVDRDFYQGKDHFVTYSVTDSCGTKTSLTLKTNELSMEPTIDIELNDYLIRVPKGTNINARSYIENIKVLGVKDNTLKQKIDISNNYNPNVAGTYEFIYSLNRSSGEYGITKLVVIVE